jgi:uncharacterized protein (DUF58 family)
MIGTLRHRLHEAFVRWALRVRPPEPAPIILSQRRVYVLPTRAGLAYATALGVILLGAMNYNLSLGHALVFLLAGLGIVAILHTFRNLVQVSIRPGRCEPVFAGSHAQFDVVLENRRDDARTSLRLSVDDEVAVEVDIGPQARTVATINVPATRRGWLPMPRLTIETTWPLGLVRAWSYASPDLNCLVYPAPAASAPPLPWSGDSARGASRDGRGADDFSGLRNHQDSDPPRHVAWKAVARQHDGPLLTKLFSGAAAQQIWLDWDALPEATGTEQRLSVLARWMLDADLAGLAWGLRLPGIRLAPDNGPAQLAGGLRALALHDNGAS